MSALTTQPNRSCQKIRVLLVDHHRILRDGLRLSLERQPDMEVVGDAGDRTSAVQLTSELSPDAVVMDLGLPDGDGVELSREILLRRPDTRIVILTGSVSRERLDLALAAGIRNCVLKSEAVSELQTAIRRAMRQQVYFSHEITGMLVESYRDTLANGRSNGQVLSDRETTVLKLMADGRNAKEIATALRLSVKSVDYYRGRLMTKLGARSVAELTKYAIRKGLTAA